MMMMMVMMHAGACPRLEGSDDGGENFKFLMTINGHRWLVQ